MSQWLSSVKATARCFLGTAGVLREQKGVGFTGIGGWGLGVPSGDASSQTGSRSFLSWPRPSSRERPAGMGARSPGWGLVVLGGCFSSVGHWQVILFKQKV